MNRLLMSSVAAVALCVGGQVAYSQSSTAPTESNRVTETPADKKAAPKSESKEGASPSRPVAGASEKETDKKDPASTKASDKAEPTKPASENKEPATKSTSTPASDKPAPKASTDSKEPTKSGAAPAAKEGASPSAAETKPSTSSPTPPTASTSPAPAGKAATSPTTAPAANAKDAPTQSGSASATSAPNAPTVPPEQATKINDVIARENVKPAENVNFSVSVGVNVPSTVSVHPLPPSIVEVVPQYRGYDYIVVRDEVVILEPRTRKIVTVIHRGGGASGAPTRRISIAPERRKVIKQTLVKSTQPRPQGSSVRLTVGAEVPQTYEIREFPADVLQESPELREYEYVVDEDNVIVVDRRDRRVIEILD